MVTDILGPLYLQQAKWAKTNMRKYYEFKV